ncbi:T9SS type A sorting domain-containing protein [Flavobacterium azooxidireducens]|uniref:T9SS type A sorting domain-containing protein n=1 Tax=Flavobacterium azooxidireducens TaxID=1871076 RepID=A0ABY4KEN3_9FLAO|nr:T9SS type A sorting domain-containing protein [Flavobacterium azooxidireducens]UPQ78188.1 T9SS type A sorting domain-containing protein [Flavobacterium azooxidireducens]
MKKLYFIICLTISFISQAQVVNFPDDNLKSILLSANNSNHMAYDLSNNVTSIDLNNNGEIELEEAQQIAVLYLSCEYCDENLKINSVEGIEYFSNLRHLDVSFNSITTINSLPTSLGVLTIDYNLLNSLNIENLTNLGYLSCSFNPLNSLIIPNSIQNLNCFENNLTILDLSNASQLYELSTGNNNISSLDLSNSHILFRIDISNTPLTNISINSNHLRFLYINDTNLEDLNLTQTEDLWQIYLTNNNLSTLLLPEANNIMELYVQNNNLTNLDLSTLYSLRVFHCQNNNLVSLDFSNSTNLYNLNCSNNLNLNYLNIKNGSNNVFSSYNHLFNIQNNTNLTYLCVDEDEESIATTYLDIYSIQNCNVGTYCNFNLGGEYFTVNGETKFDFNINGCDSSDENFPHLNLSISDENNSGTFISNNNGEYFFPLQEGSYTITPILENPTYFTINPASFIVDFPTQTSPLSQDFCITPNGIHHDVEVVFIPTTPARPGFDAHYKIFYKNKGNQVENGSVLLTYYQNLELDLVSSNPIFSVQTDNTLEWSFTNLQPNEVRLIDVVFNLNSPTEVPAVNIGDMLIYKATITPFSTDEHPFDNSSGLQQIVVGSYDPNDKTCIEGTIVNVDVIGQYVHYVIRFENTGNYHAENIVIKDMIDLAKFDSTSLIPLHSSHDFFTRISGNKVEFIFEGINLPFDDATNDGFIVFKIKTKSDLEVGDSFSNEVNIYFDYNFPITTNTFTTTIQILSIKDFDFGTYFTLHPNPVKDVLNLHSKNTISIHSIEIYNQLGQIVLAIPNDVSKIDVSRLRTGNYFVKVNTNLGTSNTRFIKE